MSHTAMRMNSHSSHLIWKDFKWLSMTMRCRPFKSLQLKMAEAGWVWQSWKLNSWSFTVHTVGPLIHPNNKQWRKFTNSALCHLAFASYGAGCWSCHVRLPYNFVANHRGYMKDNLEWLHLICLLIWYWYVLLFWFIFIDLLTNQSHVFFLTLHDPGWVHDFEVIVPLFVYMWNTYT